MPSDQHADTVRPVVALLRAGRPLPEIDFPWPDCPICGGGLEHDDSWWCMECEVFWQRNGTNPEYDGAQIDGSEP